MSNESSFHEVIVGLNIGRSGQNLMTNSGRRLGTVVLDSSVSHVQYATVWNGRVSVVTVDVINGRSDCYIPLDYFNVGAIQQADLVPDDDRDRVGIE